MEKQLRAGLLLPDEISPNLLQNNFISKTCFDEGAYEYMKCNFSSNWVFCFDHPDASGKPIGLIQRHNRSIVA